MHLNTARHWHAYQRGSQFRLLVVMLLAGCNDDLTNPKLLDGIHHSACKSECGQFAMNTLLNTQAREPMERSLLQDLASLETACQAHADQSAMRYQVMSIPEFIEYDWPAASRNSAVLIDPNGHMTTVLSKFESDGQARWQVVHGNSLPAVMDADALRKARFVQAWLTQFQEETPIRYPFGEGGITVSDICRSMGLTMPYSNRATDFIVKNDSGTSLTIKEPIRSSCGCTSALVIGSNPLPPGDECVIQVSVDTRDAPAWRQCIWPVFTDGEETLTLELTVMGNQRQSMKVIPESLRFGTMTPDSTEVKTIRVREVPTDRFQITNVESDSLPITWSMSRVRMEGELSQYNVNCEIRPTGLQLGSHEGILKIRTTSRLRPEIVIPVYCEISADVRAVPGVVSFGNMAIGEIASQRFEFRSKSSSRLTIRPVDIPPHCQVHLHGQGTTNPWGSIDGCFPAAGLWKGAALFEISSGDEPPDIVQLQCVAHVQASRHQNARTSSTR